MYLTQAGETDGVNEVIPQLHMNPTKISFHLMGNISK